MSDGTQSMLQGARAVTAPLRGLLTVVHPPGLDLCVEVGEGPLILGREPADGTSALGHPTVSRRHVELRFERDLGHVAGDLGSRNGTRVNGLKLTDRRAPLTDNTVLQVGEVFLVYERLGHEPGDGRRGAVEERALLPGRSLAQARLRERVRLIAPDPSPVLLVGETGVGKEWVARALHAVSGRAAPMVPVNCAAISPLLFESQLFGHLKGAFTGAVSSADGFFRAAEGGTLFLDEIGELPLELQPKLLRTLQDQEVFAVGATRGTRVDVRVIAATNRDLRAAVEAGRFRRDLYARLALWELEVPPLRGRRVDILDWLGWLHEGYRRSRGSGARVLPPLAPDAVEAVLLHGWTENLRELDRLVHAVGLESGESPLRRDRLPGWLHAPPPAAASAGPSSADAAPPPIPDREAFVAAFQELEGNVRALARRFARDRRQIYRWMEAYGLKR